MRTWIKFFASGLVAAFAASVTLAQQPVVSVSITQVDVLNGATTTGFVNSVTLIAGGAGYTPSSTAPLSFSGGGGSGAAGTATINSSGGIASVSLTSGGSGYSSAPAVSVGGGTTRSDV